MLPFCPVFEKRVLWPFLYLKMNLVSLGDWFPENTTVNKKQHFLFLRFAHSRRQRQTDVRKRGAGPGRPGVSGELSIS